MQSTHTKSDFNLAEHHTHEEAIPQAISGNSKKIIQQP